VCPYVRQKERRIQEKFCGGGRGGRGRVRKKKAYAEVAESTEDTEKKRNRRGEKLLGASKLFPGGGIGD
jgi:hypothetical protein